MNNKQKRSNALNELELIKKIKKVFSRKKAKNNAIMLDMIPKLVCFSMVAIVVAQTAGIIVLLSVGAKNGLDMSGIISEIAQVDFVTTGITIIGIAVSVWVGLNIYLSLSKEESEKLIQKMGDEIKAIDKCLDDMESTEKHQKAVMWQEFINLLDSQRNENMMSAYFAYLFGRLLYEKAVGNEENIAKMNVKLIYKLMKYENEYISMVRMYENGEKKSCFDQSERLIKEYKPLSDEGIKGSDSWEKTFSFYFNVRISDAKFYRNAVCLRLGGYREKFNIEQMKEVCSEFGKVFDDISDMALEYTDINSAKAYLKNTMGYTLDLINQYEVVTKDNKDENNARRKTAHEYMQDAVDLLKEQHSEKKARYLRNLGLTHERLGDLDKAYDAYVKSIKEDMADYKSWTVCGSVILKKIENEEYEKGKKISFRNEFLCEMKIQDTRKWKAELLKAKTQFEMSASAGKGFEDPYYKLIQVYTYLYMIENGQGINDKTVQEERNKAKNGAEKYLDILKIMEYRGGGSMYAYRNYYEAIGDIEKANEINEQIPETKNNDVGHMRELYKKKLEENKDE